MSRGHNLLPAIIENYYLFTPIIVSTSQIAHTPKGSFSKFIVIHGYRLGFIILLYVKTCVINDLAHAFIINCVSVVWIGSSFQLLGNHLSHFSFRFYIAYYSIVVGTQLFQIQSYPVTGCRSPSLPRGCCTQMNINWHLWKRIP